MPSRQPRVPSIGFDSVSGRIRRRMRSSVASSSGGRNSWSGGSRSRIVTGSPAIASKIASKSDCWNGRSRSSASRRPASSRGEDHLLHHRQPLVAEEHVLGAAEPDALRAELARLRRVLGVVGVRAHLESAQVVGPVEDRLEVLVDRGRDERDLADDDASGAAVDRDHVALAQLVAADADGLRAGVDVEAVAAGDARLAHPARDDGRVRRHAAVRGEDALAPG